VVVNNTVLLLVLLQAVDMAEAGTMHPRVVPLAMVGMAHPLKVAGMAARPRLAEHMELLAVATGPAAMQADSLLPVAKDLLPALTHSSGTGLPRSTRIDRARSLPLSSSVH